MPRPTPEEELEKQYKDYKAQFDQWKEKNKNSTGTPAYLDYVRQFETWEKDVEKRRRMIKEKAEQEAENDRLRAVREEQEREEMERQQKEAESARQAEAYAEQHSSYLAHHVAAMEAESRQHQAAAQAAAVAHQMAAVAAPPSIYHPPPVQHEPVVDTNADTVMMQEMMNIVMGGAKAAIGVERPVVGQQPPGTVLSASGPPPQLWGSNKVPYGKEDSLFAKWGPRAAPAHSYIPPPPNHVPTPCWLVMEEASRRKTRLAGGVLPPPTNGHHVLPPPPVPVHLIMQ